MEKVCELYINARSSMQSRLPLAEMTIEEKICEMEAIWADLSQAGYPTPGWHEEVLSARRKAVESGTANFVPWDQAKGEIRDAAR